MMEIRPCVKELEKYLPKMREYTEKAIRTGRETGYSIGITPDKKDIQRIAFLEMHPRGYEVLRVPKPLPSERPFLQFHSHPPGDMGRGLSAGDTVTEAFRERRYDYFCVGNPADRKIRCYRSGDVVGDPAHRRALEEHARLSLAFRSAFDECNEMRVFRRLPPIKEEVLGALARHDTFKAYSLLKKGDCHKAAKLLKESLDKWSDFITRYACATFEL